MKSVINKVFNVNILIQLYIEPANILKLNDGNDEKSLRSLISMAPESDSRVPSESKINGRLTFSESQVTRLDAVIEIAKDYSYAQKCNKAQEVLLKPERRSDEKIIAEILKPEERIRLSRSADRLLKVSGTNSAISLE